jgi:hypothetical protein
MYASRSRFPKEQEHRGHDVVPFVTKDWPPEAVRDLDAEPPARRRGGPSIRPARSAAANDEPAVSAPSARRPSFGRRVVRRLFRFVIAVMIGVGVTLGLQMHGNEVRDSARIWAPVVASMLDGVLPVLASASTSTNTSTSSSSTVATPATFADLVQQVGPLQQDLAGMRRSMDELAARQDQMVQAIAALQAAGQDVRPKPAPPPAPPPAAAPHRPTPPKAQSSSSVQSSAGQQSLAPQSGPPLQAWPAAR